MSDDVLVLRVLRATSSGLRRLSWRIFGELEVWSGVSMENGQVVVLMFYDVGLTGAIPAEVGRLTALRELILDDNQLTSVPAEIGQLTSLEKLTLRDNQLTSVPAEIGQLTSLTELSLYNNKLGRACRRRSGSSRR